MLFVSETIHRNIISFLNKTLKYERKSSAATQNQAQVTINDIFLKARHRPPYKLQMSIVVSEEILIIILVSPGFANCLVVSVTNCLALTHRVIVTDLLQRLVADLDVFFKHLKIVTIKLLLECDTPVTEYKISTGCPKKHYKI